jgi:hypothetical protein
MVLVSEPAAAVLAAGCPGKGDLERALIAASKRPLWMRTYAHYWANTGSKIHLNRTFDEYYPEFPYSTPFSTFFRRPAVKFPRKFAHPASRKPPKRRVV